jgi:predicted enzyme related to lactoylglutathione lyase
MRDSVYANEEEPMGQPVAMFEIVSNDHQRAQEFYASLFGWNIHADRRWAAMDSLTPAPVRTP